MQMMNFVSSFLSLYHWVFLLNIFNVDTIAGVPLSPALCPPTLPPPPLAFTKLLSVSMDYASIFLCSSFTFFTQPPPAPSPQA